MQKGSRYNQLIDYLKGLKYDKYIIKINELIRDPKLKFLIDESFGGYLSDDVLKFSVIDIPVRKLLPCQNEIDVDKSLKYALSIKPECIEGMFKNPVVINLPLVTFNGNFIIDGHHRWSQVYCYNINAKMTCWNYEGDFSAMQMLKMMQAAIGSNLGEIPVSKVNGINLLTAKIDKLEEYIRATAKPEFYELYAKYAGVDNNEDEIINIVLDNVESMQADNAPIKDAPERGLMPQTDKAPEVLEDIKEGVVVMSKKPNKSFSYQPEIQKSILSIKDKSLAARVAYAIGDAQSILNFDDQYHKLDKSLKSDYENLVDKFKDCKTDSDFEDWIESYKSLIDRTFSNRSYAAPKVLVDETEYYVDIDEDRIYVKIGEHDADHEDAPYEEYTYYFDKKEWEPSLPELPYNIKKVISDYIKDTDVFSDKNFSKRLAVINFDFDSKGNFPKFHNEFFELVSPFWDGRIGLGRGEYPEKYEVVTEGRDPSNWNIYIREDELNEFMDKLKNIPNITINKADTFSYYKNNLDTNNLRSFSTKAQMIVNRYYSNYDKDDIL